MKPTLLILAAGMGSRYGGLKQVDPVGPGGETLMDYAVFDAIRAGFGRVVFVIRRDFEQAFRDRVDRQYRDRVAIDYAFQSPDDLPPGFAWPDGRSKPWGTAHAIRAARDIVDGPFAAINADDFYGRDAFARLAAFPAAAPASAAAQRAHFAMVGFELRQTLSEHGSVARGVCEVGPDGMLRSVTEHTGIEADDAGIASHEGGVRVPLVGSARVSMNMWGFTPALFGLMEAHFAAWLARHGGEPKAEWYIPSVVNDLVLAGSADVRVLPTDGRWFGVTYRADCPRTVATIAGLVAAHEYPERLWAQ